MTPGSCYPSLAALIYVVAMAELNGVITPSKKTVLNEMVSRALNGFDLDGAEKREIIIDSKAIEDNLRRHFAENPQQHAFMSIEELKTKGIKIQ